MKGSNGVSVYDNSLIVVYGDHADHSRRTSKPGDALSEEVIANRSNLIIKYPKSLKHSSTKQKMTIIDDRAIYAPHLNQIINHALNTEDGVDFIKTNHNFNPDRNFLTFMGPEPYAFTSKFVGDKEFINPSNSKLNAIKKGSLKLGWFEWDKDQSYIEELFKSVR